MHKFALENVPLSARKLSLSKYRNQFEIVGIEKHLHSEGKQIRERKENYKMKRRGIAFCLVLLHACLAVVLAFAESSNGADRKMNFEPDSNHPAFARVFTNSELGGTIAGVCFGEDCAWVYSDKSYLLMNETGDILYQHTIDHPNIEKDAAFINDAIFCDDTLWLLIFDHSVEQSYIIQQTGMERPQYGKLMRKQLRSFSIVDHDILLAGADESLMPWCGRMTLDGEILWEDRQETSEYVYQQCAVAAGKMYVVGSSQNTAELQVTVRDTEGVLLASRKIQLTDSSQSKEGTRLHIFDMEVFSNGITLFGQRLSNSDAHGFYLVIDEALEPVCSKVYEDYGVILSGSRVADRDMMLAVANEEAGLTNARYIILEDESCVIPLEEYGSMYLSLGVASGFDDRLYVFGSIFHSDNPPAPSSFLSEINLQ